MIERKGFVYILTNSRNTVLYTGVTSDLIKRIHEHKNKEMPGFTTKYNLNKLVYYEAFEDMISAITREKQIKGWLRSRKIALIERTNPKWIDLYTSII